MTSLRRSGNGAGFVLDTSDGPLEARAVVLATGAYQRSHRPAAADSLPAGLLQIDVGGYDRPTGLPEGPVLVVGSGQSGAQIAEELHQAGRDVFLACGRAPWLPRRIGDRDLTWWAVETGFLEQPVSALPEPAARLEANLLASGRDGGHDLHLRTLQRMGVNLVGRFLGCEGRHARFAPDLGASVAWGDERYRRFMGLVDKLVAERELEPPGMPEPETVHGRRARNPWTSRGFGAVLFAGGYRPDYASWVDCPGAFDELGFPVHDGLREHGRARPLLRRCSLPAHAQVRAARGCGRGRRRGGGRASARVFDLRRRHRHPVGRHRLVRKREHVAVARVHLDLHPVHVVVAVLGIVAGVSSRVKFSRRRPWSSCSGLSIRKKCESPCTSTTGLR